jgi:hypothetical protein
MNIKLIINKNMRRITQEQANERVEKACEKKNCTYKKFDYIGCLTDITIICKECKHDWPDNYNHFVNAKHGCPKCAGNYRPTSKEANEIVRLICVERDYTHEPFDYVNQETIFNCTCNKDGRKWTPMYGNFVNHGKGCPDCKKVRLADVNRNPQELVMGNIQKECDKRGYKFLPFVYVNTETRFDVTCIKHNLTWSTTYFNFIKGHGCAQCDRDKRGVVPDHMLTDWKLYKRKVNNLTIRNKKKLFEDWDGYDAYDGKYIKDNFNLHSNSNKYPTIDHKTPVIQCFLKGISIEICGSIENLCVTTRGNNSEKHIKTEEVYKKRKGLI